MFKWVTNLLDPATVYAYSMITLHHDIMWYMTLILSIVCWCLYKIIKESSWTISNKQRGFLRSFFYFFNYNSIQAVFLYSYFKLLLPFIKSSMEMLNFFIFKLFSILFGDDKRYNEHWLYYILVGSKNFSSGLYFSNFLKNLNFGDFYNLIEDRKVDYYMYSILNNGEFYYDDNSSLLINQHFRHSTNLEFVWASFPTCIIYIVVIPSLLLIYALDHEATPAFTIKVIGNQWFWSYEYNEVIFKENLVNFNIPDLKPITSNSNRLAYSTFKYFLLDTSFKTSHIIPYFSFEIDLSFDSCLILTEDLPLGSKRLLEVDNRIVLPTNVTLRILVTSGDVVHSWAIPELGIKIDSVPGRINQFITVIRKPGIYYGQCSELCGVSHGFMPIVVHAVDLDTFLHWVKYSKISYTLLLPEAEDDEI